MSPYNPIALKFLKGWAPSPAGPPSSAQNRLSTSLVPSGCPSLETPSMAVYQLNLFSLATSCSTDKRRACLFAETGSSRGGMS